MLVSNTQGAASNVVRRSYYLCGAKSLAIIVWHAVGNLNAVTLLYLIVPWPQ